MVTWLQALYDKRSDPTSALALARAYLAAPASERIEVRDSWEPRAEWNTPNPWRLACMSEGPGSPKERIETTLLFQVLDPSPDSREDMMAFAVLFNTCRLVGLDPKAIFEEIAEAVGGSAADALRGFAKREPSDQSMEAFMLVASPDAGGGYEIRANW